MYTPKHFQNHNVAEIKEFIKQNSFGILITQAEGNLLATHIPLHFSDDDQKLVGHISKANPQWKNFNGVGEVLVVFSGPHAYVSSSWYNHENVPTWNYIAAHVYGKLKIIEGEQLHNALKHLVDKYEKHSVNPVSVENMSTDYVRQSMQGIVGFEISITKIEASYKLSQNRDSESYHNIIHELSKSNIEGATLIAKEMQKNSFDLFKPNE